jgi:2-iminobutanoate/2-iminopropanoate deaminase
MKEIIKTDQAPAAVGPYSQAVVVKAQELVYCAGQIPLDPATQKMVEGDVAVQTRQVLNNVKGLLEAAGSSLDQVVKANVYLLTMSDFADMNAVYKEFFAVDPPARAAVAVHELPMGARVEIEVIAAR